MNAPSGKRPGSPGQDVMRKKTRFMVVALAFVRDPNAYRVFEGNVRDLVDIEASEGADGETTDSNDDGEDGFIDDDSGEEDLESSEEDDHAHLDDAVPSALSNRNCSPVLDPSVARASNDRMRQDCRLEEVINRYDAQIAVPQDENQDGSRDDSDFWNDNITSIADGVTRMPSDDDPPLWRVRVRDGTEEESFFLLNERLQAWPRLALTVFLPPGGQKWICVESACREYVEKLCIDLSTFTHPLQIFFVPVEERLTWLKWQHRGRRITVPAWGRLKRRSELKELLSKDNKMDERILKYANDLVYIDGMTESTVFLCMVPRLPVPILKGEDNSNTRKKYKRMQRLLQPLLGDPVLARQAPPAAHMMDPTVWWHPNIRYDLEVINMPLYRLTKPDSHGWRPVKGGDDFLLPFAFFEVPHAVLKSETAVPELNELKIFAEGMTIGGQILQFVNRDPSFMRWTYENHVAACVEIGQKVEANVEGVMKRGIIDDIFLDEVILCINNTEQVGIDARWVRRFYEVGDKVKVAKASNLNREGWVVSIREGEIEVFDRDAKENFHVQSWQLIPHDSFERGLPHEIQVGDSVRVVSRMSADFGERGRVWKVTELGVDVIGDRPNTKFTVPHWFLEVDPCKEAPVGPLEERWRKERHSLAQYDHYQELVNTWVQVTGDHAEKGLYGRIRASLGEGMMQIENRAGTRLLNIHVDFLLNDREKQGRDLTDYYIGRYQTPATMGRRLPTLSIVQPVRATTPGADEPTWPDETPIGQRDCGATSGTGGSVENVDPIPTAPDSAAAIHLPQLPRRLDGNISYENQVIPANWIMKGDLVTKRIWAHVRNSKTDPFEQGGFARGRYEGQRVLVLSGEGEGQVVVSARQQQPVKIPAKYLFPERPTSKGQDVVVISGDNIGEVYLTRKPRVDGFFPLGRRGYTRSSPFCIMEASRLARCDPLSRPEG
ncbi:hypothetical protein F5887DRAFT_1087885 [Amanita rubescens]|nr:hypothetical protein F5887DRAFT_1087885 [Amanita rubescens]